MAKLFVWQILMKYVVHLIFYLPLRCVQLVYWNLNGVQNHINKCKKGENYESSAQLLKVWSYSPSKLMNIALLHHYLSTHVRFVHPEYALQKHITLMTVTDKEAIFSIPAPDEHVHDLRKWPLLPFSLPVTAKYLLIMPINSMNRLADTIGNPSAKVIWIHHTGRCGSTAIGQVFNALPDVICLSEPICMFSVNRAFKKKHFDSLDCDWMNSEEYLKIYHSMVRLLLKPYLKTVNIYAVKSMAYMSKVDLYLIPKLFPQFTNIFMYRDAKPQIVSMFKLCENRFIECEFTLALSTHPLLSWLPLKVKPEGIIYVTCNDPKHLRWNFSPENRNCGDFSMAVVQFAETCFHFIYDVDGKPRKPLIPAFKYEHLQSNQTKYLETLFDSAGLKLTEERLRLVRDALKQDSQKGTYLDKELIPQLDVDMTPGMIKNANKYLKYYGLVKWGDVLILPNTVSSY